MNLFHSFEAFNVEMARGVFFQNPEAIANILTRVTGAVTEAAGIMVTATGEMVLATAPQLRALQAITTLICTAD